MDKNERSFQEKYRVAYKLALEVLFLVILGFLGYIGIEFLLPGLFSKHISFFSIYTLLVVAGMIVIVFRYLTDIRVQSVPLGIRDVLFISVLGALWITLTFEKLSFLMQILFFILIFFSFISLVGFLSTQKISSE